MKAKAYTAVNNQIKKHIAQKHGENSPQHQEAHQILKNDPFHEKTATKLWLGRSAPSHIWTGKSATQN